MAQYGAAPPNSERFPAPRANSNLNAHAVIGGAAASCLPRDLASHCRAHRHGCGIAHRHAAEIGAAHGNARGNNCSHHRGRAEPSLWPPALKRASGRRALPCGGLHRKEIRFQERRQQLPF